MAQEEWLVSRNKISKFDELLDTWTMNLNKENVDEIPIINWIRAQLEAYKVTANHSYDFHVMRGSFYCFSTLFDYAYRGTVNDNVLRNYFYC